MKKRTKNYAKSPATHHTIIEALEACVARSPSKTAFTFLKSGECDDSLIMVTYKELYEHAQSIAFELNTQGYNTGTALLLYPSCLDFIYAFFGCIYAGMIPVPAVLPEQSRIFRMLPRLKTLAQDCGAKIALTLHEVVEFTAPLLLEVPGLETIKLLGTDKINKLPPQFISANITSDSICFLQYTSGSTSLPKGVMVTHSNIVKNLQDFDSAWHHDENSVGVSWLPIFHDLGLIYGILNPIFCGYPCYFMSPESFLGRPLRWLEAISKFKGTHSCAPNFGYELCLKHSNLQQVADLDLSSWAVALNAAEPVRKETLENFYQKFKPAGLKWETLSPGYGLAEATLKITTMERGEGPRFLKVDAQSLEHNNIVIDEDNGNWIAACGRPCGDTRIKIVDPESLQECKPNKIGEIWIHGSSVTRGYWNKPEATELTFNAKLTDSKDQQNYLRTGDLGFIYDGLLYITGRIKDLIIIRGRNIYPSDIEVIVEHADISVRMGCVAAFSVTENNEEKLIVVLEVNVDKLTDKNFHELTMKIRDAIWEQFSVRANAICLLEPRSIFKTSSGKIQRQACAKAFADNKFKLLYEYKDLSIENIDIVEQSIYTQITAAEPEHRRTVLLKFLKQQLSSLLGENIEIDENSGYMEMGLDSVLAVAFNEQIINQFGQYFTSSKNLNSSLVFDYPTLNLLSEYILQEIFAAKTDVVYNSFKQQQDDAIAIIGMSCRFPHADNVDEYWNVLHNKIDAVSEIPKARFDVDAFYSKESTGMHMNVRGGAFLNNLEQFDANFFNINKAEATALDPQQRLLLEVSWEALENARIIPANLSTSNTGVFVGMIAGEYENLLLKSKKAIELANYIVTGNTASAAAGRLSYFYGLQGPSVVVDTACSSSLVAIHLACESLLQGDCDLAMAAGVNALLAPERFILLSNMRALSPNDHCKTFSNDADGYVRGEGCGVLVLKRLSDAIKNNDNILGIVCGSAVAQDGKSVELTAPNGAAQQKVILTALNKSAITPDMISFVETHGTGTPLGDPIEFNSLAKVYSTGREKSHPLILGAVKTNIGHLESAAGIASVIKILLSMREGEIPANLNFSSINQRIDLEAIPALLPLENIPWPNNETLYAAVSSFGITGTIAHTVIKNYISNIQDKVTEKNSDYHILCLSAKTKTALAEQLTSYLDFLASNTNERFVDICASSVLTRSDFEYKAALVAQDSSEAVELINNFTFDDKANNNQAKKIAFLFTGQGSQYSGMGSKLYEKQKVFKDTIDKCQVILGKYIDVPLVELLWGKNTDLLSKTQYAQPAIFALEYSLYQLWSSWGIKPDVVTGHSVGEYVAACVAGVMNLDNGLRLISARAKLMQNLPENGAMLALRVSETEAKDLVAKYSNLVSIAAVNGKESVVLSGMVNAIQAIADECVTKDIKTTRLNVSHAFHSQLIEPMLDEYKQVLDKIVFDKPTIEIISNLTGDFIGEQVTINSDYWLQHTREAVQFAASCNCMFRNDINIFIEIGPSPVLIAMAQEDILNEQDYIWLSSMRKGYDDQQHILNNLAKIYECSIAIDWRSYYKDTKINLIDLPTYKFQRQRYWYENNYLYDVNNPAVNDHDAQSFVDTLAAANHNQRVGLLSTYIEQLIKDILNLDPNYKIDPEANLVAMGVESLMAVEFRNKIISDLGDQVNNMVATTLLFNYPNIRSLVNYLLSEVLFLENAPENKLKNQSSGDHNEAIAVIGMACRFPNGANNIDEYWNLLKNGVDAVNEVPADRWNINKYYDPDPDADNKMYCKWGGFLAMSPQEFDAEFFEIPMPEAQMMDPQQRMALEVTWSALENANLIPHELHETNTAVFFGVSTNDYATLINQADKINAFTNTGIAHSALAGRISYELGLQGPSMVIDTACSSSLVAIHEACKCLLSSETDLAIAGGVNLMLAPETTIGFCRGRYLSPDGSCKTFDDAANGYIRGEGVGVIILKRLSTAIKDQDNILALISGTAVNQDGAAGGLTVPNGPAQESVIKQALNQAHVEPKDINYIEVHGTGTPLGDPIEVNALTHVLREGRTDSEPLVLSAVKTNIGHLEAAAGIASVIKVILALKNETIPKILHFNNLNHNIKLPENYKVLIANENVNWSEGKQPRIAGVSAFGFQGTNSHLIITEAPKINADLNLYSTDSDLYELRISAKSESALRDLAREYINYLNTTNENYADICYTAFNFRSNFKYGINIKASTNFEASNKLQEWLDNRKIEDVANSSIPSAILINADKFKKVTLPNYRFQHKKYWFKDQITEKTARKYLLKRSDTETDSICFVTDIDANTTAILNEHRVYNYAVFPAVGFIETVYQAVSQIGLDTNAVLLENLSFENALTVEDASYAQIKIALTEDRNNFDFRIDSKVYSHDSSVAMWNENVFGSIVKHMSNNFAPQVNIAEIKSRCGKQQTRLEFYTEAKNIGIEFGLRFASLHNIWLGDKEALGEIILGSEFCVELDQYQLYPPILDCGLQLLIANLPTKLHHKVLHLPVVIKQISKYTQPTEHCWAHVTWSGNRGDIRLYNDTGMLIVEIIGLVVIPATQEAIIDNITKADKKIESESVNDNFVQSPHVGMDMQKDELQLYLLDLLKSILKGKNEYEIDIHTGFMDLGVDSLLAIEYRKALKEHFGDQLKIPATVIFDYPNVAELTDYIYAELSESDNYTQILDNANSTVTINSPIAIIGMGCRFPGGANSLDEYWELLSDGRDGISEIPSDRWDKEQYYDPNPDVPGKMYSKWGGFLKNFDIHEFDANFFKISGAEARAIDPQQRLLLEVTWEALENAGINPLSLNKSKTAVYIGQGTADFSYLTFKNLIQVSPYTNSGAAASVTPGRISYFFGLRGPSMAIDTACSSSLVAIHQGCNSLRLGESDLVIAGGVNLMLTPDLTIGFSKAHMLSPDGRCKTFDAKADGYARAEGCGVVILKRLSEAERDGDRILAIVKGSATNQDGASSSLTAPNGPAQQDVISQALKQAGISPSQVSLVEAHGTGTALGDPIEVQALANIYGKNREKYNPLYISSVKTNFGHLETAAGMAAVIKVVLAMQHKIIPKHLHFQNLNPGISLQDLPFVIPSTTQNWDIRYDKRYAGVSGFAFQGSNAHILLEEAPVVLDYKNQHGVYLFCLSAKNNAALSELIVKYIEYLDKNRELNLADICYTACISRSIFEHRLALLVHNVDELTRELKACRDHLPNTYVDTAEANQNDQAWVVKLREVAGKYMRRESIDWRDIYPAKFANKIQLPNYAFQRQKYWMSDDQKIEENQTRLLGRQIKSSDSEIIYESEINLNEFGYLRDHVVAGRILFPAAAFIEMALTAALENFKLNNNQIALEKVVIAQPLYLESNNFIKFKILQNNKMFGFDIQSKNNNNWLTNVSGNYAIQNIHEPKIELQSLYKQCAQLVSVDALYDIFKKQGIAYGASFRPIIEAYRSDGVAFTKIELTAGLNYSGYAVHPTILDAAFQSMALLWYNEEKFSDTAYLPFEIERVILYKPAEDIIYAKVSSLQTNVSTIKKANIDIYNTEGDLLIQILGFNSLATNRLQTNSAMQTNTLELGFKEDKKETSIMKKLLSASNAQRREIICGFLDRELKNALSLPSDFVIDRKVGLAEIGVDSLMAVELRNRIINNFGLDVSNKLPATLLFNFPNIDALSGYLLDKVLKFEDEPEQQVSTYNSHQTSDAVAIIGASCRFPGGANSLSEFWQLLSEGRDGISIVPGDRWNINEYYDENPNAPDKMYCKWGGFLNYDISGFDANFFHIKPLEAEMMDPQQRIALEVTWEALENACIVPADLFGSQTGVFFGVATSDYADLVKQNAQINAYTNSGLAHSVLAGRISYELGLEGPSLVLDTACSSSLVALHQACRSLHDDECKLAIVGGVNLVITPEATIGFCKGGFIAKDGHCKTFDESANGYVRGEGIGVIVLKKLVDAQRDHDNILGIILGSAVNQDGASSGLTVPNGPAQERVIRMALDHAKVTANEISYVETHGTGTALGDPIEVNALTNVLQAEQEKPNPLILGAVKTNIGHLEAAAGMASIIKVLLAFQNNTIPKNLNFNSLNHNILTENVNILIPKNNIAWQKSGNSRLAGVSGFAFQGTNAHVIISEPDQNFKPPITGSASPNEQKILCLSAKTPLALKELVARYVTFLTETQLRYDDICYSANKFRTHFACRLAIVALNNHDARDKLQTWLQTNLFPEHASKDALIYDYMQGKNIDWANVYNEDLYCKVQLPNYPFQHEKYWVKQDVVSTSNSSSKTKPAVINDLAEYLAEELHRVLGLPKDIVIDRDSNIAQLGLDSLTIVEFRNRVTQKIGHLIQEEIPPTILYDYPNINKLDEYFKSRIKQDNKQYEKNVVANSKAIEDASIAIIGISCRFPGGANDTEKFWEALRNNNDCISEIPADRYDINLYYDPSFATPGKIYSKWGGFLNTKISGFDAKFFGISDLEADSMDPQQRLALELTWEALEDANIKPQSIRDTATGVYFGVTTTDYAEIISKSDVINSYTNTGVSHSVLAGRISFLYGLNGPCMAIDTACSSSLIAIHEACVSLKRKESNLAIAGGVNLIISPTPTMSLCAGGFLAPDGRCKTFDDSANGYVRSDGAGVIILKRLSDALRDNDDIYAIIKGSAINQDGASISLTAPNGPAQQQVIRKALLDAQLATEDISYIEAHGTGTALGDPIELHALSEIFKNDKRVQPLMIGSVKANIGHTEAAAGVASVIKVVLAIKNKMIPKSLHFTKLNHMISVDPRFNFKIPTQNTPWESVSKLRAGVSGFAFQGSNAHIILEEAPSNNLPQTTSKRQDAIHHLILSAGSDEALRNLAEEYIAFLMSENNKTDFGDICYTAYNFRTRFKNSITVSAKSKIDAADKLKKWLNTANCDGVVNYVLENIDQYRDGEHRKAKIPTYRFVHKDYWINIVQAETTVDVNEYIYDLVWEQQPLAEANVGIQLKSKLKTWLLFSDHIGYTDALCKVLETDGHAVTIIDFTTLQQLKDNLGSILFNRKKYDFIVNFAGIDLSDNAFDVAINSDQGYAGCLLICQEIIKNRLLNENGKLCIVTRCAQTINLLKEELVLSMTPILGLGRNVAIEHPELNCKLIDLNKTDSMQDQIVMLRHELESSGIIANECAYRGMQRFIPVLQQVTIKEQNELYTQSYMLGYSSPGIIDNLEFKPIARVTPGPNEVEIEVFASGLNFRDVLNVMGMYPGDPGPLGGECAGRIVAIGPNITEFKIGDPVMAEAPGALRKYVTTHVGLVVHKPSNLTFTQAAAIPIVFLTVYYCFVVLAKIKPGQKVLIHAAAGGVGMAAIEMAKMLGAEIYATAGTEQKRELLKSMGVKHIMNSRSLDFAQDILELTNGVGVDVVLNSLTGEFIPASLNALRKGGVFIEIGKRDIWPTERVASLNKDINYHIVAIDQLSFDKPNYIHELLANLKQLFDEQKIQPIQVTTYPIQDSKQAFKFMAQGKHVGKIVLSWQILHDESTYLLTGGTGGLGIKVAEQLISYGAKFIVLLSKSEPKPELKSIISGWQQSGVTVVSKQVDLTSKQDISSLLDELRTSMPPLKGIIHAAGIIADGMLLLQNRNRYEQVIAPKVLGAWNLHQCILKANIKLDFWINFSSLASLLGNVGQANYAAANAFLNAFAFYQRELGIHGTSIAWGPWDEVGMAARMDNVGKEKLLTVGVHPLNSDIGVACFAYLLFNSSAANYAVADINWELFVKHMPPYLKNGLLTKIATKKSELNIKGEHPSELITDLKNCQNSEQRRQKMHNFLNIEIKKLLNLESVEDIPVDKDFSTMGLDSLMAVEFRNKLVKLFGNELSDGLPATTLINYKNIRQLSDYLLINALHLEEPVLTSVSTVKINKSWIVIPQPKPNAKIRLFCFLFMGGTEISYYSWASLLPNEIELCCVAPFSEFYSEEDIKNMKFEDILQNMSKNILPYLLDKPFCFLGHSLGVAVAYEFASFIVKNYNCAPQNLYLSSLYSPAQFSQLHLLHSISNSSAAPNLNLSESSVTLNELMQDKQWFDEYKQRARIDAKCIQLLDYNKDHAVLNSNIYAFYFRNDNLVKQQDMLNWQKFTTGTFAFQMLDGGHFDIFTTENRAIILDIIKQSALKADL